MRHPKKNRQALIVDAIPRELVTEILCRVAASSVADISNVKSSCKVLREIAEDREVYRRTCLDKFPLVAWTPSSDKKQKFLNKCRESDNPELCYREALFDFFNKKDLQSALQNLDKAVKFGHVGALYVKSIVLLLSGDYELERKGLKLIRNIKKFNFLNKRMKLCCARLNRELRKIWVKISVLRKPPIFCSRRCRRVVIDQWSGEEEEGDCEACDADREIEFLSSRFTY